MTGLNIEQTGFDAGGAAQPPQETGKPQHQLPLDCRLGIVIKRPVIVGIFQRANHSPGGQPMTEGIATRALLTFLSRRTVLLDAFLRLAAICRNEVIGIPLQQLGSFRHLNRQPSEAQRLLLLQLQDLPRLRRMPLASVLSPVLSESDGF